MNVARSETWRGSRGYTPTSLREVCQNENRVGGDRAPYLARCRVAAAAPADRRCAGSGRDRRGDGGLEDLVRIGRGKSGSRPGRTADAALAPATKARFLQSASFS